MKVTNKQVLEKLVSVYREINMLTEDSKAIVENAVEEIGDKVLVGNINKLAKLMAKETEANAVEKMKSFLSVVEELA